MSIDLIQIKRISSNKFDILAGLTRKPAVKFIATEIEHYSDGNETYLGTILIDHTDMDFSAIVLARDEYGKFVCIEVKTSMQSNMDARQWLFGIMKWHSGSGITFHPQNQKSCPTLNLFKPVVPREKQHAYFTRLISHAAFRGARKAISEMMPHFVDVDGNFVQQFQSDGFDSRVWELYLFAMLKESGFELDRSFHAPDFVGNNFGKDIALEAVIVGRKPSEKISSLLVAPRLPTSAEVEDKLKNEMPIRFGSPLFSKLKKEYWNLDHVKGKPLVIAIADFHDEFSMVWSHSALYAYLYGKRYEVKKGADGALRAVQEDIQSHNHEGKIIPSGFFLQSEAENISAVLTSASGTISKFNRMARQAGYGDPDIKVYREGYCHDHDPGALKPEYFKYEVNEESSENWSEGINIYHNPNANIPLDPDTFPFAGHHTIRDSDIVSMLPDFHPYSSWTINFTPKGKENYPDGIIVPD